MNSKQAAPNIALTYETFMAALLLIAGGASWLDRANSE
jgi:hypothetical protein